MSCAPLLKFNIQPVLSFPDLLASDQGEVYRRDAENPRLLHLKTQCWLRGYAVIGYRSGGKSRAKYVHRLVAEAFHGRPKRGQLARHLDDKKANNRADNLAWGSYQDNSDDAKRHGRTAVGERNRRAKITEEQALSLIRLFHTGLTTRAAARAVGVPYPAATAIRCGVSWKHLGFTSPARSCQDSEPKN